MNAPHNPQTFRKSIIADLEQSTLNSFQVGKVADAICRARSVPDAYCCFGCDAARADEVAFCASCDEMTSGYPNDGEIAFVPQITARCVDRDERLFAILTADRDLTASERAYVDAAERSAL